MTRDTCKPSVRQFSIKLKHYSVIIELWGLGPEKILPSVQCCLRDTFADPSHFINVCVLQYQQGPFTLLHNYNFSGEFLQNEWTFPHAQVCQTELVKFIFCTIVLSSTSICSTSLYLNLSRSPAIASTKCLWDDSLTLKVSSFRICKISTREFSRNCWKCIVWYRCK